MQELPGVTCRVSISGPGRRCGSVTAATPLTARGLVCWLGCSVMPMLLVTSIEFLCSRFWLTFESHGPTVVVLTCPAAVLADRAYGPKADREYLCSRGIRAVIPEKKDQIAVREKRGSNGGGPPAFDAGAYRNRDVVGRSSACLKRWRRLAARSDKPAIVYRAAVVVSAIRRLRR